MSNIIDRDTIYLEVNETLEINGVKIKAVVDNYEPFLSCKACCFGNNDDFIVACLDMACQHHVRQDKTGVIFEFVE